VHRWNADVEAKNENGKQWAKNGQHWARNGQASKERATDWPIADLIKA